MLIFLWVSGALAQDVLYNSVGGPADARGVVAALGDVDGDGADDFAIGSPGAAGGDGLVDLVSATKASLGTLPTVAPGSAFGSTVVNLGDQTGDGFPEIAVGAPALDLTGTTLSAGGVISGQEA